MTARLTERRFFSQLTRLVCGSLRLTQIITHQYHSLLLYVHAVSKFLLTIINLSRRIMALQKRSFQAQLTMSRHTLNH